MSRRSSAGNGGLILLLIIVAVIMFARQRREERAEERTTGLDTALTPDPGVAERDGLAAMIAIDVSGSMNERAGGGSDERKIVSARRAAIDLVEQFARYADDHKGEPVLLGVYEFSDKDNEPDLRPIVTLGPPDRVRARAAIDKMEADGGTPIGNAMISAKKLLDSTGLSRRHLLVVTDGENTSGPEPEDVAAAIARRPASEQPSMYFVAFDISASRFNAVRDAGGLVLEAANAKALNDTLDSLLRGKILIEK
jgi:Ca-activated chloride channel family protein